MTKRDYNAIARGIVNTPLPIDKRNELAANIAQQLWNVNPTFNRQRFMECFKDVV